MGGYHMVAKASSILVALLLLSTVTPVGANNGGGTVNNVAPLWDDVNGVESAAANAGDEVNAQAADFITAQVDDKNKVYDIDKVDISNDGGSSVLATLVLTGYDKQSNPISNDPATPEVVGDFRFYISANQKTLFVEYSFTYPNTPDATFTWHFSAQDDNGATDTIVGNELTVVNRFELLAGTFNADGTGNNDPKWGSWAAIPGAPDVTGANYLVVRNSGTNPGQQVVLDFTGDSFVLSADDKVAIDGNMKFAVALVAEGTSPGAAVTNFDTLDENGALTVTFTDVDQDAYIRYQFATPLPDPLADGAYTATFTAGAVN